MCLPRKLPLLPLPRRWNAWEAKGLNDGCRPLLQGHSLETIPVRDDNSIHLTTSIQEDLWFLASDSHKTLAEPLLVHTFDQNALGNCGARTRHLYMATSNMYTTHECFLHLIVCGRIVLRQLDADVVDRYRRAVHRIRLLSVVPGWLLYRSLAFSERCCFVVGYVDRELAPR